MSNTHQSTSHGSGQTVLSDEFSNIMKILTEISKRTDANAKQISENAKQISENAKQISENAKQISENAKENAKISEMVKENARAIRSLTQTKPILPESKTRSKLYKEVVFETVNQAFFLNEVNPDDIETNSDLDELPMNAANYLKRNPIGQTNSEPDVRNWFERLLKMLGDNWPDNLIAKDTHKDPYLRGYMPDFTIIDEQDALTPLAVQTILELKKQKRASGFSDDEKGQLIDYLHILVRQQPLRKLFAVFLSDGIHFYAMSYDRNTNSHHEFLTDFKNGLDLFNTLICQRSRYISISDLTSITFQTQYTSSRTRDIKIHLDELLGIGSSSKAYKIKWNQSPAVIKVISDVETLKQEVEMLRLLENNNIQNVTKLIHNDLQNIIITPVCEPFNNNFRAKHYKELLDVLHDIHRRNIYHRDVRPENIMLNKENDSVVLIDWGSAVQHNSYDEIPYLGTTSYASPSILANNMRAYEPRPSDDLHSFVRATYVLHNPLRKPTNMRSCSEILTYWNNELNYRHLWKQMSDAAENNQIDELKKLCDIFT